MASEMLAFYHFPTKKTFFGFVTQLFARIKSQVQVKLSVLKTLYLFFFRMAQRNASSSRHLHALCCASGVLHSCLICRIVYGRVEEGLHSDVFTSHSYYFTYCVVIFAKVKIVIIQLKVQLGTPGTMFSNEGGGFDSFYLRRRYSNNTKLEWITMESIRKSEVLASLTFWKHGLN